MGVEWSEIHYSEAVRPAREYDRAEKVLQGAIYEHDLTEDMVTGLEVGE